MAKFNNRNLLIIKIIYIFAATIYINIMEKLIGRKKEKERLLNCYHSNRSELLILYGRRRVGKTFLVNNTFKGKFSFYFTGLHNTPLSRQLEKFGEAIQDYGGLPVRPQFHNWYHAFDALKAILKASKKRSKKVIFFDEMPWISSRNSNFVSALEDFWNTWAALRDDILLIATGSTTSWMVDHLLKNKGGLYNRITCKIYLRQFNLQECEEYLRAHHCYWDRYAITQYYMYLGGVPFYLSLLSYDKTLEENIDEMFFDNQAKLAREFYDLYDAQFKDAGRYVELIKVMAERREGMTRQEIINATSLSGGGLSVMLENLERNDLIRSYTQYGNKRKGTIYRVTDFFTIFYLKYVDGVRHRPSRYWFAKSSTPSVAAWRGLTFELVCLLHIDQINLALGIMGMLTSESCWRSSQFQEVDATGKQKKAQIDMIIERTDRIIHLCEMKFSSERFIITKKYEEELRDKMTIFKQETKTTKMLNLTFVTAHGVAKGLHAGIVQSQVTIDDLFESLK